MVAMVAAAVVFSGCVLPTGGGSVKEFDPIEVPAWETGYSWTYRATRSFHASGTYDGRSESQSESDTQDVTLRVFNTTQPVFDEAVYYVRSSQELYHPFLRGTVQALTQSDLALAAYGYMPDIVALSSAEPTPASSGAVAYSQPMVVRGPIGPCSGVPPLTYVPDDARFPLLDFPLDDGQSFSGRFSAEPGDPFTLRYVSRVRGLVDVTVPAGTFPAVYVTQTMEADLPPEFGGERSGFDVRLRAEHWYSPDVRYLAKSLITFTGSMPDFDGGASSSIRMVMNLELVSFDLTVGPDEPAPPVQEYESYADVYFEPAPYRIVTDTMFPINVAEGSATARFALQPYGNDGRFHESPGAIEVVGELPPAPDFNHSSHHVVWTVTNWGSGGSPSPASEGDVLTFEFDRGGVYEIHAEIQPIQCGGYWLGSAHATVAAFWEKTFQIPIDAGLPRVLQVGKFPVEPGASSGFASWSFQPAVATNLDRGHPLFYAPDGRVQSRSAGNVRQIEFSPHPPGGWSLGWDTETVTVGDDVRLTLRINYDHGYAYG